MYCLRIVAILAFFAVAAQGCDMDQGYAQKMAMECVVQNSDTVFMMEIAKNMQNLDDADPTLMCKYKTDLVKIVMCIKSELEGCVPEEYKSLMAFFPSKERLTDGLEFVCEHQEIMGDQCMMDNIQNVMQCYMGKVQTLAAQYDDQSVMPNASEMKNLFCSAIRIEEQCFRDFRGTCTKNFINMIIAFIEKVLPMESCPKDLDNTIMGSILIHGVPQGSLKFQPKQFRPYVIKN